MLYEIIINYSENISPLISSSEKPPQGLPLKKFANNMLLLSSLISNLSVKYCFFSGPSLNNKVDVINCLINCFESYSNIKLSHFPWRWGK